MNREKYNKMCDEIGGFLGNRDWHGPNTFVDMALDPQLRQWASYFDATPKDIVRALKRIKREDKVLQDFIVGNMARLNGDIPKALRLNKRIDEAMGKVSRLKDELRELTKNFTIEEFHEYSRQLWEQLGEENG